MRRILEWGIGLLLLCLLVSPFVAMGFTLGTADNTQAETLPSQVVFYVPSGEDDVIPSDKLIQEHVTYWNSQGYTLTTISLWEDIGFENVSTDEWTDGTYVLLVFERE